MYQYQKEHPEGYKKTGPTPKIIKHVYKLALLGSTDKQMADFLEIPISTFDYWKQHKTLFRNAIKKGKTEADANVANALYRKAVGFWMPDIHIMANRVEVYDDKGKVIESRTEPLIVNIKKYYPPDYQAANKWLSMRDRKNWADVQKVEITHNFSIDMKEIAKQLTDGKRFTTDEIRMALHLSMQDVIKNNQQLALDN